MLLGFLLFEGQFVHVVAITFTSLILNELLLVALTIRSWHGLMLLAELISILIYIVSLLVLKDYFGKNTHVIHNNTHTSHTLVSKSSLLLSPLYCKEQYIQCPLSSW